jgi:hypothetical protein
VIVVYAIYFIVHVDGEWNTIQTFVADAASETARMIAFAHSLQDHLHNKMATNCTLFSRLLEARVLQDRGQDYKKIKLYLSQSNYQIVLFTINPSMHIVECLSAQCTTARTADEAVCVVQIAHSLTGRASARHLLLAGVTNAKIFALFFAAFHFFLQLSGQLFNFSFCL